LKGNKQKIAKALKTNWCLRYRSVDEIIRSCKFNTYPTPIFKNGFWVNQPNKNYKKVVFPVAVMAPAKREILPSQPDHGRGRRLNAKLRAEARTLLSKLEVPKMKICRDSLRKLRSLDRHLCNILEESRNLSKGPGLRLRRLYSLIVRVPFKKFGDTKFKGSLELLPNWARRVVSQNISSYKAIRSLQVFQKAI
jgi:hypothetical protein